WNMRLRAPPFTPDPWQASRGTRHLPGGVVASEAVSVRGITAILGSLDRTAAPHNRPIRGQPLIASGVGADANCQPDVRALHRGIPGISSSLDRIAAANRRDYRRAARFINAQRIRRGDVFLHSERLYPIARLFCIARQAPLGDSCDLLCAPVDADRSTLVR